MLDIENITAIGVDPEGIERLYRLNEEKKTCKRVFQDLLFSDDFDSFDRGVAKNNIRFLEVSLKGKLPKDAPELSSSVGKKRVKGLDRLLFNGFSITYEEFGYRVVDLFHDKKPTVLEAYTPDEVEDFVLLHTKKRKDLRKVVAVKSYKKKKKVTDFSTYNREKPLPEVTEILNRFEKGELKYAFVPKALIQVSENIIHSAKMLKVFERIEHAGMEWEEARALLEKA